MKVKVVSTKLIKPCTPTPHNLKTYKLSITDELSPPMNVSAILFYPPINQKILPKPAATQLQESLAKTQPQFYPLAGRYIKKDLLVDCNDEGAEFVQAQAVDMELMDIIATTENVDQLINELVPRQSYEVDQPTDPMLSIQITELKCGALVISITASHRIVDAYSVGTFISAWSINSDKIFPTFYSPKLFLGRNLSYDFEPPRSRDPSIVVKRVLFNNEAIARLRSEIRPKNDGSQGLFFVSRVRIVSALIAKALIFVDRAKQGKSRDCFVAHAVNMRQRTIPALPNHSCGNLAIQSVAKCAANESYHDMALFQELVYLLRDALDKTISDCSKLLSLGEDGVRSIIIDPVMDLVEKSESGEIMLEIGLLINGCQPVFGQFLDGL